MLQCVAVCCSVLQCVAVCCYISKPPRTRPHTQTKKHTHTRTHFRCSAVATATSSRSVLRLWPSPAKLTKAYVFRMQRYFNLHFFIKKSVGIHAWHVFDVCLVSEYQRVNKTHTATCTAAHEHTLHRALQQCQHETQVALPSLSTALVHPPLVQPIAFGVSFLQSQNLHCNMHCKTPANSYCIRSIISSNRQS